MEFYIDSYVKTIDYTGDFKKDHSNVYFIMGEYPDGRRYTHYAKFPDVVSEFDDEGVLRHTNVEKEALVKADRFLEQITNYNPQDLTGVMYWNETTPRYGSEAWIRYEG